MSKTAHRPDVDDRFWKRVEHPPEEVQEAVRVNMVDRMASLGIRLERNRDRAIERFENNRRLGGSTAPPSPPAPHPVPCR